jgi:branched-chain amino acid aminotransferase
MQETEKIWMNGELVDWADARVHVGAHGLHYGTGVFEGIRCYDTERGPAVFRLQEHLVRLHTSAGLIYRAALLGRRAAVCFETIRRERAHRVLPPADRVLRVRRLVCTQGRTRWTSRS